MSFFNPLGFLALLGIPAIIFMYLLKEKHKEIKVPSLFLWQKAIVQSQSHKPWQKLRKNLLMILQIIMVIFLAFALSNPYILGGNKTKNYIFALDSSLSMLSKDESPSRFEQAKNSIQKIIDDSPPNAGFSIVVMNQNPYLALNNSNDKNKAKSLLSSLECSYSGVDFESALSIIEIQEEQTNGNIYVFSDKNYDFNTNVQKIYFGKNSENSAITNISHSFSDNDVNVLVSVRNFSDEAVRKTVTLFTDNNIFDFKDIIIESGENEDIYFTGISKETKNIMAQITPEDNLVEDDTAFHVINSSQKHKVLLVTQQNIFIEKALSLLENVELYRSNTTDLLSGYELYIFDGIFPEIMPTDGYILSINPNIGEEVNISENITINNNNIFNNISNMNFAVSKAKSIDAPNWADVILKNEEIPLIYVGENQGVKNAMITFDLHNSDLPLKKEFPIFIYNMLNWFFLDENYNISDLTADSTIEFNIKPNSSNVDVIDSDGKRYNIAPPFPVGSFSDTQKLGIYTLEQTVNGNKQISYFAVNPKTDGESKYIAPDIEENSIIQKDGVSTNKRLRNIFILLLILLLAIEWKVNCYES